jgi:hypothetical protein
MDNKIFILGVGAQKCGTTWLHSQLSRNLNVDMGFTKEYHILDAIAQERTGLREKIINSIIKLHDDRELGINAGAERKRGQFRVLKLAFMDNISTYFDYFDYLYLKNPKVEAVGDITPNYAILQPEIFKLVKKGLKERGFDIKVFFLMRDPVERIWSSVRMKKRAMAKKPDEQANFDEIAFLQKISSTEESIKNKKSEYEFTIKNLEQVFDPSELHYGFYETLFSTASFKDICNFLGIHLAKFESSTIINASPKQNDLPAQLSHDLSTKYAGTYEFILNKFGNKMLNLWEGYKFL